ncbi:hypothetical protein RHMOL_Rhmol13G0047300 [Rhododendron molle]|uniref:Uncharacterized protein n=2 Tax=Rhododendron molle TaxID=49168 RepID=A0ACC0L304_RHOML|nr:hypothetical protein RHMOL_Rhmol13G0047300 [Rhododendron molle]KAI8523091.1 hypothetical protein RHMOL_Rhmol13G0047300 [Rhododendron molle]
MGMMRRRRRKKKKRLPLLVEPNFAFPWKMEQEEGCRSGFIVSGRKVLTSAGAVDLHQEVKLKKGNCDVWYTATVLSVAYDTDLGTKYFAISMHSTFYEI